MFLRWFFIDEDSLENLAVRLTLTRRQRKNILRGQRDAVIAEKARREGKPYSLRPRYVRPHGLSDEELALRLYG